MDQRMNDITGCWSEFLVNNLHMTYCYLVGMMGGQLLKKFRTRLFLIQFYSSISRFEAKIPLKKINYEVFMSFIFLAIGSSENA